MLRYRLTTPEQVTLTYQLAGLVTRAIAWGMDMVIMIVLMILVGWVLVMITGLLAALSIPPLFMVGIIFIAEFLIFVGYFIFCEQFMVGRSPGKRIMGLRVVSASGGRLVFVDILIRNLLRPVDFLPSFMFLGGVTAFIDPRHRRLGDFAANTIVIRDRRVALPKAVTRQQARHNSFHTDPTLRGRIINRLNRLERDLVMDLALRRDTLDVATRENLFADTAGYLRRRLGLSQTAENLEHLSDEQMVLNVALVLQDGWFKG